MPSHQIIQATRPIPSVNYPVVESLLDLFARWLRHRREIAELRLCDANLRPNFTPAAIARLRPSPVRSRISSRSNSAISTTN